MEINRIETYYGQCRCCLAKGHHRYINREYSWNGLKEIYSDMFLECFNLFISTNMNVSTLICETCIERLRDASSFKHLVTSTELQLLENVESDDEPMMLVNVPIAEHTFDTTVGFKIELKNMNTESKNEIEDDQREMGNEEVASEVEYQIYDDVPETEPNTEADPEVNKTMYITEKMALINNVSTILEFSNITAFKSKTSSGFPCFYCRDIYENIDELRVHQNSDHFKTNLKKFLKKYSAESLVVYADVTNLKCTLCNEDILNIKHLKEHLIDIHNKIIYKKYTDRIIPFKIAEDFVCQICGFSLETFGAIERHMNVHYRNYICEECGTGFITMLRLKTHIHTIHKVGKFPCNICNKVYTSQQRYRTHVDFVHRMIKKLKCSKCNERFSDYFVQKRHLVDVHGEKPLLYRCNVCDRTFNRRYTLSCHMKRRHLNQKDFKCDFCTYTCYSNTELKEHLLKHSKVRLYNCSLCKKSYSRKKTLITHMRVHNSDKKFVCSMCGQGYVHQCSLKIHMKSHIKFDE